MNELTYSLIVSTFGLLRSTKLIPSIHRRDGWILVHERLQKCAQLGSTDFFDRRYFGTQVMDRFRKCTDASLDIPEPADEVKAAIFMRSADDAVHTGRGVGADLNLEWS